jgi:hypothetical protein
VIRSEISIYAIAPGFSHGVPIQFRNARGKKTIVLTKPFAPARSQLLNIGFAE